MSEVRIAICEHKYVMSVYDISNMCAMCVCVCERVCVCKILTFSQYLSV